MVDTPPLDEALQLERLFEEARALVKAWRQLPVGAPPDRSWSQPHTEVLLDLERAGSQTVPQLARRRRVSRQHVQVTVNRLAKAGLVAAIPNPRHRRSPLLRLTHLGADFVRSISRVPALRKGATTPDLGKVDDAIALMESVRRWLSGGEHPQSPESMGRRKDSGARSAGANAEDSLNLSNRKREASIAAPSVEETPGLPVELL